MSQVSVVMITTSYGLDGPGFNPGRGKTFSVLQTHPDHLWGPPSLLFNGYRFFFLGVSRPGCDVDHSPLSSCQVTNEWSCTSAPPAYLRGVHRNYVVPRLHFMQPETRHLFLSLARLVQFAHSHSVSVRPRTILLSEIRASYLRMRFICVAAFTAHFV